MSFDHFHFHPSEGQHKTFFLESPPKKGADRKSHWQVAPPIPKGTYDYGALLFCVSFPRGVADVTLETRILSDTRFDLEKYTFLACI